MKTKLLLCLGIALMAMVAVPYSVAAKDFTFKVRVNVKKLDDRVTGVTVICRAMASGEKIAERPAKVLLNESGAFKGKVTITANAFVGRDPEDADSYICYLTVWSGAFWRQPGVENPGPCDPTQSWVCPKPGSFLKNTLEGPILKHGDHHGDHDDDGDSNLLPGTILIKPRGKLAFKGLG